MRKMNIYAPAQFIQRLVIGGIVVSTPVFTQVLYFLSTGNRLARRALVRCYITFSCKENSYKKHIGGYAYVTLLTFWQLWTPVLNSGRWPGGTFPMEQ